MPTYSSPGTYVIEKDFSDYPTAVNSSIAGIVGFASKGPANKATLITSTANLLRTFGSPEDTDGGQGLLGALEILAKTNSIYYVRAEDETTAKGANGFLAWGSCPAVEVEFLLPSGDVMPSGTDVHITVISKASVNSPSATYDFDYTTIDVLTGATSSDQLISRQGAIETADFPWTMIRKDDNTVYIVNREAGNSSELYVSATLNNDAYSILSQFSASGIPSAKNDRQNVKGFDINSSTAGGAYFLQSLHSGKGYNFEQVSTSKGIVNKGLSVKAVSKTGKFSEIQVYDAGVLSESFQVSFEDSGYFMESIINTGDLNATSEHLKASFANNTGTVDAVWTPPTIWGQKLTAPLNNGVAVIDYTSTAHPDLLDCRPRFCKLVSTLEASSGISNLVGGKNGDFQGSTAVSGTIKSALIGLSTHKSGIYALDDDFLNISMACVPGITDQDIQNTLVSLAERSQNFLAVISPPFGLTSPQQAINWHNGQATARTAAVNNSYAAIYWPWLKVFDVNTSTDIYMDPAAFAIGVMCNTDAVSDPWFAPAGLTRGRLTKPTDVEVILNQGDRDQLYQPGNAVNPIAKFAQDGIVIWGQRTAQRTPSALDRVNIRRMMIVIRKMILQSTRTIIFEPNDPMTWNRVVNLLQPALDDIRRRRGITEFRVICDETTNTSVRIDRNELWCRVMIKPTKTAEILVFELNLTNQSASIGI